MAQCDTCKDEMTEGSTDTCSTTHIAFNGVRIEVIPYGKEEQYKDLKFPARCSSCNISIGGVHHPGCTIEECPKCNLQLFSCDCLDAVGDFETGRMGVN